MKLPSFPFPMPPLLKTVRNTIAFRIMNTMRLLASTMDARNSVDKIPLAMDQSPLLIFISAMEGLSVVEIAKMIGRDKAGVFRALISMQRKGYIRIVADIKDKRRRLVYMDKFGRELLDRILETGKEVDASIKDALTEKEIVVFYGILDKIESQCTKQLRSLGRSINDFAPPFI